MTPSHEYNLEVKLKKAIDEYQQAQVYEITPRQKIFALTMAFINTLNQINEEKGE